jgi:hypothetical protein
MSTSLIEQRTKPFIDFRSFYPEHFRRPLSAQDRKIVLRDADVASFSRIAAFAEPLQRASDSKIVMAALAISDHASTLASVLTPLPGVDRLFVSKKKVAMIRMGMPVMNRMHPSPDQELSLLSTNLVNLVRALDGVSIASILANLQPEVAADHRSAYEKTFGQPAPMDDA